MVPRKILVESTYLPPNYYWALLNYLDTLVEIDYFTEQVPPIIDHLDHHNIGKSRSLFLLWNLYLKNRSAFDHERFLHVHLPLLLNVAQVYLTNHTVPNGFIPLLITSQPFRNRIIALKRNLRVTVFLSYSFKLLHLSKVPCGLWQFQVVHTDQGYIVEKVA